MQNLISATSSLKLTLRECFAHGNCLIVLVSTFFIFIIDLNLPLGVAAGAPYALIVFASLWISGVNVSYVIAILGISFTIAGFFLSPGIVAPMHTVFINRALTLLLIICAAVMVIRVKKANIDISALMNQVLIDPVTGFKNGRALEAELSGEIQRCRRYEHPLSLAIIEIKDHESLHSKEDDPGMKKISQEIEANIRKTDFPYNINSNTLAVIFTETSLAESKSVCEIILKRINTKMSQQGSNQTVLKVGITALCKSDNELTLLDRAKNALSIAKSNEESTVATLPQVKNIGKAPVAAILSRSRSN